MSDPGSEPRSSAGAEGDPPSTAALFASWVEERSVGDSEAFERLLAAHPGRERELREMRADWDVLRRMGFSSAVARLQTSGAGAPPSLAPDPADATFAEKLVARLSGRGAPHRRYRLEGEIARGGQGAIVHVWDEDLRRNLAMKVLLGRAALAPTGQTPPVDSRSLGRFLEEAQVTSQLDHPGIVPVHELGLDADGRVYFTMKLVKGEDLRAVFEKVRAGTDGWTRARATSVLLRVCEALAYAHAKGVIHRDLKPGNVMVGAFGEVYVMDWGLARVEGHADVKDIRIRPEPADRVRSERRDTETPDSPLFTMDGEVVGTPAYMPPEQALGRQDEVGPHSDVYALGAMLYHLLAGHPPYLRPDVRLSNHALWARVQRGLPEPLAERAPGAPAELVAIAEKAMARAPAARYRDTGALAEDLRAFLEGRVVAAYRTGPIVELEKWVRRNRALAGSIAAGVLALAAGLVASLVLKAQSDRNALRAAEREQDAKENFDLAEDRFRQAEESRRLAEARRDEVLRLSARQDLEDHVALAAQLWPPFPERIGDYERWVARARELVGELPLHRAKRDELRAGALPWTAEERAAERASHPAAAELARIETEILFRTRALAQRRDGVAAELPEVDWARWPADASALNAAAWALVDPARRRFGDEGLGLVLARRALELARGPDRAPVGDTVALAYLALGRDDEALEASLAALEAADEGHRQQYERALAKVEEQVASFAGDEGRKKQEAELATLAERRAALERTLGERHTWRFADAQARWWNDQLTGLIDALEKLEQGCLAEDVVTAEHGWSVPKRLAFARALERDFAPGGVHARAWDVALPAIRAAYGGLALEPVLALVPLGPDPASHLWEFGDLQTGTLPRRGENGRLELTEATALVFVLLPGGTFVMGAQASNPAGQNYSPDAQRNESPPHAVTLSPFFLAKHEMTQGQWLRVTGTTPSAFGVNGTYGARWNREGREPDLLHPVEQIDWFEAGGVCARLGYALPSEAQWEYAARGGTTTPWWTASDPRDLAQAANLADRWCRDHGGPPGLVFEDWDDGNTAHAAIGSYAPNPFGFHDVHGNVWEWCADGWDENYYAQSPARDPLNDPASSPTRVYRGGSCAHPATGARSAYRGMTTPALREGGIGLRPARACLRPAQ